MRKFFPVVLAACGLLLFGRAAHAQTDILQVIPQKALVAVIMKNPEGGETNFREMVGKLTDTLPKQSFLEQLLVQLKVRKDVKDEKEAADRIKASTMDLKSPGAVVLVVPALDVQGMPLGVVVKVGDYKKLLAELAEVKGAVGPEVTPDGTDVIKGEKESLFVASFGSYAVIADAEYVIKTFKAEAKNNLAASDLVCVKDLYAQNDLAVYVNVNDLVTNYAPQIENFKTEMLTAVRNNPPEAGMPPEKLVKILEAEIDFSVKLAHQTEAVGLGFRFAPDGARLAMQVQAVPDTTLAKVVGEMKPAPLDLLQTLDGPALVGCGWNFDQEMLKDIHGVMQEFIEKAGLVDEKDKDKGQDKDGVKGLLDAYKNLVDMLGGQGAMVWSPPTDGKGLVRLSYIVSLKPNADVRKNVQDYLTKSFQMMNTMQSPLRVRSKYEVEADTYRGCGIDKLTITFELNPDVPAPANAKDMLKAIEMVYGPQMVVYESQVQDKLVYTLGFEKEDALKAQMDKLLDHKPGDLVGSAVWQSATAGLPPGGVGMGVIELAEMMRSFGGMLAPDMDMQKTLDAVKFDKPSGVGTCVLPTQKGFVVLTNVPMQEMLNIKALIEAMTPTATPAAEKTPANGGNPPPPAAGGEKAPANGGNPPPPPPAAAPH